MKKAARVGIEPYLSSLKNWRPHLKPNEPNCFRFSVLSTQDRIRTCNLPGLNRIALPLAHLSIHLGNLMGREGIEPLAATSPIHGIRVTTGREDHDPTSKK